ncbi:hypothetical protein [Streptomyces sp. MS191]|uniref:hypothetical protein n=1 Tax=Streptomyces sp. ms191 TaxID=1827978 RepID=UPI0011CEBFD8|nr:hypothetical protein [Streptomyces sp. ms191]
MNSDSVYGLSDFLFAWYGKIQRVKPPAVDPSVTLPPILAEWYEFSLGSEHPLTFDTRCLAPTRLREESGHTKFWVESQGCWEWAFRRDSPDFPVYFRDPGDRYWKPAGVPLAGFLIAMAVHEAVQGAPCVAYSSSVTAADLQRILAFVAQPGISAPEPYGTAIYLSDGLLAEVEIFDPGDFGPPLTEDRYMVTLASRNPQVLGEATAVAPNAKWRLDTNE